MEQRDFRKCQEDVLDSKGQSILLDVEKSCSASPSPSERQGIVGRQHLKSDFATVTPEKSIEISHVSCDKEDDQYPKKYQTVMEFFDRMTCSLRLLSLCKKSPAFSNICIQVERLTGRKFEYKHLAQIKYVLHEAVQIEKILVQDPESMCMKPEIQVSLIFDIVEGHHEESVFIALSHIFASRLRNFLNRHPEACDIPEAVLPEPFNKEAITIKADQLPMDVLPSIGTETLKSSHLCPSFNRHFSVRAIGEETEKTRLAATPVTFSPVNCESMAEQEIERLKTSPDSCLKSKNCIDYTCASPLYLSSRTSKSTPRKLSSENDKLMLETQTPAQSTPKRSLSTCKNKNVVNQMCMPCDQTAKRSLDFSRLDDEESSLNYTLYEIEQSKTSQTSSVELEMKGISTKSHATVTSTTPCRDKTSNSSNEKGHMSNTNCLPARKQASICLSGLIFSIQRILEFRIGHSMTKEELIHKIIMDNCDIDESSSIEEQIELLVEQSPDWICKKLVPSGDIMYNIKKVLDLNSVCERVMHLNCTR